MWLAFVHCRVSRGLYRSMVNDTTTILSCLQEGCSHKFQWTCRLRDHPFAGGCSWSYLAYSCYLFSHPDLSNRLTSWVSNSISIFYPWIKRLLFTTRSRPLLDALCERGQSNRYWSGESHASLFKITKLGHHQFLWSGQVWRRFLLPTLIDWYTCMSLPFTDDPVITFLLLGAVDLVSKGHSLSFELKAFIIEGKHTQKALDGGKQKLGATHRMA